MSGLQRELQRALVVLALSLGLAAQPQTTVPSQAAVLGDSHSVDSSAFAFSTRVREVNVVFSASNWHDGFVSDLKASDVRVLDNGEQPASLTYFLRQTDLPLRIVLLIDVSGSVKPMFEGQQKAAVVFLWQTLRPSDAASLMVFSERPHVIQDFTANLQSLTAGVRGLNAGGDGTAVYDAVIRSCDKLGAERGATVMRRAVILITDGEDNASRASLDDAVDAALEHDVTVFALNTNFTPQLTDAKLKMLAESTGGRVLRAYGEHEWKSAFRKVNQELRNQYLLAYKPPRWQASHSFHKIRIAARRAGLKIHCRKGYYESE